MTINVCLLFLGLKLNAKEGTANERSHIFIFIRFIRKTWWKKGGEIADEKKQE